MGGRLVTGPRRRRRWAPLAVIALLCGAPLAGCAQPPPPPQELDDLCAIFAEREGWHEAALGSEKRWGVPVPVVMAFLHQESRFRAEARPGWRWLLGVVPLGPRSSAYGYGQVKDGTWDDYRRGTGRRGARRNDFADAVDFVGWYGDVIHRSTRVAKDDAYHLYLAYHEGPGGFSRGSHRKKAWLQAVARKVESRSVDYAVHYTACGPRPPASGASAASLR